jgi:hypothetical protein
MTVEKHFGGGGGSPALAAPGAGRAGRPLSLSAGSSVGKIGFADLVPPDDSTHSTSAAWAAYCQAFAA